MKYKLGKRSMKNLEGVNPDLAQVVKLAILMTEVDFAVTEGVRTLERQKKLFEKGASQTLNSKHLVGDAVDLAAYVNNGISWDFAYYYKIADAMKMASNFMEVPLIWGGDWQSFPDGGHFELDKLVLKGGRAEYPDKV